MVQEEERKRERKGEGERVAPFSPLELPVMKSRFM
jgi:hypothetical protein